MGKGLFMRVLNLNSGTRASDLNSNCMYANGDEGSQLQIFSHATYACMGSMPPANEGPAYVEAKGSGWCAFEQSHINFFVQTIPTANTGYIGLDVQSGEPPVNSTGSSGAIWAHLTPSDGFTVWNGQAGVGILMTEQNPRPFDIEGLSGAPGSSWMGWLAGKPYGGKFLNSPVNRISLPASHDAGMGAIGQCTTWANSRVTQTQTLDIAGQLAAGIRYFDIRPCVWDIGESNPTFYAGHFTSAAGGQGCLGQPLIDILQSFSRFLTANSSEFVILKFSHYNDNDGRDFPASLQAQMIGVVDRYLQGQQLALQPGQKVGLMTVDQILQTGTRAICVYDGLDSTLYKPTVGVLKFGGLGGDFAPIPPDRETNFDLYDSYSNVCNAVFMMADQYQKYVDFSDARLSNGEMFLLSFTLTLTDLESTPFGPDVSIINLANIANQWLPSFSTGLKKSTGLFSANGGPPNLVYVDAVQTGTPLYAALYFNLSRLT